jgi:dephospho-CoA kinase
MRTIAVTGGIASGKSYLGEYLKKLGYAVIDADKVSRELSKKGGKCHRKIVEIFGEVFLGSDGEIDRKKLGKKVFGDKESLEKLNAATHPLIIEEINDKIAALKNHKYVFVLVPLLFELNMQDNFDYVWLVLASESVRIERAKQRDGGHNVEAVIKNQINHADYAEQAHKVLYNDGSEEDFIKQIEQVLGALK